MNKKFLNGLILALAFSNVVANGIEPSNETQEINKNENTMLDRWNEIRRQAALAVGAVKDPLSARRVRKSSKPEIIIKDANVFFEGKSLEFGRPLVTWKNILKGAPRCDKTGLEWCVWEALGLKISTNEKENFGVSSITIKIGAPENLSSEPNTLHSNESLDNKPKIEWLVHRPFTGYLEIDGFGIDKETKFWELESNIDTQRNLSCGLSSCEFPRGVFGPSGMIALHLNGTSESATIDEITLYTVPY